MKKDVLEASSETLEKHIYACLKCFEIKIVKLIILFVMVSRGHSAKKKKDTVKSQTSEESKDSKKETKQLMVRLISFATRNLKSKLLGLHCSLTLSPKVSLKSSLKDLMSLF